MAKARGFVEKAHLTPEEKLKCAYFCLCRGWAQQDLADLFGVNHGRVNEALVDVRKAIGWTGWEQEPEKGVGVPVQAVQVDGTGRAVFPPLDGPNDARDHEPQPG